MSESNNQTIGYVVGGSLRDGLKVRLVVSPSEISEGSFIVCDDNRFRYYGLITDLVLGATDPRFSDERIDHLAPHFTEELYGKTLYTTVEWYPMLMLDRGPEDDDERLSWHAQIDEGKVEVPRPRPVKTIPGHHIEVRLAQGGDIDEIFSTEEKSGWIVGHTLEQSHPVRIDLARFVKRSSGIFGATGTGKSFLARIMLAGIIEKGKENRELASLLVFDMHGEYGFDVRGEEGELALGLKSLFSELVQVAVLGTGQVRGENADFNVLIAKSDITIQDIMMLKENLNLTDAAEDVLNAINEQFGSNWLGEFMALKREEKIEDDDGRLIDSPNSVRGWASRNGVHPASASALRKRLERLLTNQNYIVDKPPADAVTEIVNRLDAGRHVIFCFGKNDRERDYLLVSNMLTRRIRDKWMEKVEKSSEQANTRPVVIVIEEAHKLLSPELSRQTSFGIIAREMRKYMVTLLVIDQRPSGIDDEVMSQLGTRISGWLGDESDIRAVLSGLSGRDKLRGMLARLREKEEILLLGWGVPMPIPVSSRRYQDVCKNIATDETPRMDTKEFKDLMSNN